MSGQIGEDNGAGRVEGVEVPRCGQADASGGAGYEECCVDCGHCIILVGVGVGVVIVGEYVDWLYSRLSTKWCDGEREGVMMRGCRLLLLLVVSKEYFMLVNMMGDRNSAWIYGSGF